MTRKTTPSANNTRTQTVLFEFFDPSATAVWVAGTFNDWQPNMTPMLAMGDGRWAKQLVLPPGVYEYRFFVDGRWVSDPFNSETVPNPFGELNSVVRVTPQLNGISEPPLRADSIPGGRSSGSVRKSKGRNTRREPATAV